MSQPTIIKGPCLITYDGNKFWSKDGVQIDLRTKTFGIQTDAHGLVDERRDDAFYTITLTPLGTYGAIPLTQMLAIINSAPGTQLFGASPKVLTIKPLLSGQKGWSFPRAAMTKLPSMSLSAVKEPWGSMTFTAIRPGTPDDADSLVTQLDYEAISDTPVASDICTHAFYGTWDEDPSDPGESNPWVTLDTDNGWTLDFGLQTVENRSDAVGLCGMTIVDTSVMVKATPLTITEAQLLTALQQNISHHRGRSARHISSDRKLYLASTDNLHQFTINSAALVSAKAAWGTKTNRIGECEWHAQRVFSGGAQLPLISYVLND